MDPDIVPTIQDPRENESNPDISYVRQIPADAQPAATPNLAFSPAFNPHAPR